MNILIVEDDLSIRDLIEINLEMAGYTVLTAGDGEEAKLQLDSNNIDMVLLDVMLPKIDGFTLIDYIKLKDIPVIFITAKNSVMDRVRGLKLGADDYITKPFESIELLARIEVIAKRYNKTSNIIYFNDLIIDLDRRVIKYKEDIVDLTIKEYELFILFLSNKNMALTREQIINKVWGYDYLGETRTVDIHVNRIREKLHLKKNIKTIFKVGYRLEY
ncbi:MAG: response regulator transcription factor [Sarcina sp.]